MGIVTTLLTAIAHGLTASWGLFWESFYGLTFGFVISAMVQAGASGGD